MKASHITAIDVYIEIALINKILTENPAKARYTAKPLLMFQLQISNTL